jgi:CHAT domain-containing protein
VVIGDPDFGEPAQTPAGPPGRATEGFWGRLLTALQRTVTLGRCHSINQVNPRPVSGAQGLTLRFDPLPETRSEAEQIAELLGIHAWLGGEAEKPRLVACRSPRFLHLATHAFAVSEPSSEPVRPTGAAPEAAKATAWENPLRRPGLALAGANRDAAEGRLTAWDVTGLDLGRTEVVVLSAGLPAAEAGAALGAVGLARSFVLAGARAVVTTFWLVPEEARREVLADFYRRLLDRQSSGDALREARRSLRAAHPDPSVWGALACPELA